MDLLTVLLSRIQFAFTIGFHIIFPTLSIGIAVFLCFMEGTWLKTGKPEYLKICKFWNKIFALTFGLGVVSGVVLAYELGTNFGRFIANVGGVIGPLFDYEVLTAFFLEAGFLGIMLFGWNRVGRRLHYTATLLVTLGTILSAFWILSANSWMQTPAGYKIIDGNFVVASWWQVIFNPSFIPRYLHMVVASLITGCFVLSGVSAWYLLKNKNLDIAKPVFSFALMAALILVPIQIFIGDRVGLEVYENQPLKTAAIEANWHTMQGAPLVLFAVPDSKEEINKYAITIPYGASLINTHKLMGTLPGLDTVAPQDRPIVPATFYSFRVMVGIGFLFLFVAVYALIQRLRKRLFTDKLLQRICIVLGPLGFIATLTGWITAETGRQPWIVYNLMRTQEGASEIPLQHVIISLSLFVVIYSTIFSFYLYYLLKLIRKGPVDLDKKPAGIAYIPLEPETKES